MSSFRGPLYKDELGSYFAEAAGYKKLLWPPNIPALTLNSDSQRYLADEISTSGSIALYGIYFDTNKADIKSESAETLKQIAVLLSENAKLKLLVVGHTDTVGTLAYNMDLSSKRAASVVKELTTKYGAPAARLKPVGVSYACPVAPNKTEEGKAKNRRVALVEDSQ